MFKEENWGINVIEKEIVNIYEKRDKQMMREIKHRYGN